MESDSLATLQKNVERLQAAREAQKQLVNFQETLATLVQTTQTFINTPEAGPFDFTQDTSPGSSANEDPAGQSSEKILKAQLTQCRDTYRASITRLIQILRTLDQVALAKSATVKQLCERMEELQRVINTVLEFQAISLS
ncbi:hypothetical protein IWQ61_000961 [Dispira simplex]|nr:hypothetical protein IWQ61_000961 [Dispira simplex]